MAVLSKDSAGDPGGVIRSMRKRKVFAEPGQEQPRQREEQAQGSPGRARTETRLTLAEGQSDGGSWG